MKIGSTRLTNTEQCLLDLLKIGSGISARFMVSLVYPKSKQPEKKERTFTRRLRRLERLGFVRQIGNAWYLITIGKSMPKGGAA